MPKIPGVVCAWANIPEDATDWYENKYIPEASSKALHALHCEITSNGLDNEPIGHLDSPWGLMTVYECRDISQLTTENYRRQNPPSEDLLAGPLHNARFDIRTYRELKEWRMNGWDGGKISHILRTDLTNEHC